MAGLATACSLVLAGAGVASAGTAASGGWGPAQEVPGTAALVGSSGLAQVTSVSCASAGNCVAGGFYAVPAKPVGFAYQGFVVSQIGGQWRTAQQVPGLTSLEKSSDADVSVVSCSTPGNCSAGGYYGLATSSSASRTSAYVVSEINGKWGQAEPVTGLVALNTGDNANINSISCASPGNCTAGGDYHLSTKSCCSAQGFVVSQVHGTWGKVQQVPGLAGLNKQRDATVSSVSCTKPGECAAGGWYADGNGVFQGYVADQKSGTWGQAREVPGLGSLNKGKDTSSGAVTSGVSCASPGNCAAGGSYSLASGNAESYVASERNGTWEKAAEVRGASALKKDGQAAVDTVSCASPGNCAAVGRAFDVITSGDDQSTYTTAFVVSEVNGTWGQAEKVPGLAALNQGNDARLATVDCPSAGNCVAGGYYTSSDGVEQAMLTSEVNGTWSAPAPIAGLAALTGTSGGAAINSVSCAAPGKCSAGGAYIPHGTLARAFVVSRG